MKNKKSITRHVFLTNTVMILIVIGIVLAITAAVLFISDAKNKEYVVRDSEVSRNNLTAVTLLETYNWPPTITADSIKDIEEVLSNQGFTLILEDADESLLYGTEIEFDEYGKFVVNDGKAHLYAFEDVSFLTLKPKDTAYCIYAIDTSYINFVPAIRTYSKYIAYTLLAVAGFILVLCVVSFFFTRRLTRHIMVPMTKLLYASEKMKEGNYTEEITYSGDWEFENVCNSMNDMRKTIQKNEEQKVEYEKSRTNMIAGISHDLRTPLTAIRGTIKGLQDGIASTPAMQKKFLDTAYRRTLEIDQLLDRLFFFSKMETGNMPIHPERLEWNEFLRTYAAKTAAGFLNHSGDCFFIGEEETCISLIDRKEMERTLDNLVENSKKYAGADKLVLQLHLKKKGDKAYIWYSDNGHGVEEEKLPHIFEKFYRGDESRNQTEGNGLGLHIVKYLTEAMHGTVEAQNREGLQFTFVFPLVKEKFKNE